MGSWGAWGLGVGRGGGFGVCSDGLADAAAGGDRLEDRFENFLGQGGVAVEADVALFIGYGAGEQGAHAPLDVPGAIHSRAVEVNHAGLVDDHARGHRHLGFADVLGRRRGDVEVGLLLGGLAANEEEDDQQEGDVAHAGDGHRHRASLLALGAAAHFFSASSTMATTPPLALMAASAWK